MADIIALFIPIFILLLPLYWLAGKIGIFRGFWPGVWAGLFTRLFVGSLRRRHPPGRVSRVVVLVFIVIWIMAISKACHVLGDKL